MQVNPDVRRLLFQHISYDDKGAGTANRGRGRVKTGDNRWPSLLRGLPAIPPPFMKRPQMIIYAKTDCH